jgi:hypothetical protein
MSTSIDAEIDRWMRSIDAEIDRYRSISIERERTRASQRDAVASDAIEFDRSIDEARDDDDDAGGGGRARDDDEAIDAVRRREDDDEDDDAGVIGESDSRTGD